MKKLLPVLDNLERALVEFPADDNPFRAGIELIQRQLWEVLSGTGLEHIEAIGMPFDPEVHAAVSRKETVSLPADVVVEEMQKGYLFHGRLLRPTMVWVSSGPTLSQAGSPPGDSGDPADD